MRSLNHVFGPNPPTEKAQLSNTLKNTQMQTTDETIEMFNQIKNKLKIFPSFNINDMYFKNDEIIYKIDNISSTMLKQIIESIENTQYLMFIESDQNSKVVINIFKRKYAYTPH